jgi:cell division septal protein FtsQ
MGLYQGRALRSEPLRPRPSRGRRFTQILKVLGVIIGLAGLAHLPWESWRKRFAVISKVSVAGAEYLDANRVAKLAGVDRGGDLFALDLARARQELLLHARIAEAEVKRRGLRGVSIHITERRPVLLVHHGVPWELDSTGVLLAPFTNGAVADVPLLTGPDFETYPDGALLRTSQVRRGLEWVRALSSREIQLGGRVSEIDVSDDRATTLLLMSGTRVISPAWPPDVRRLSALRVTLVDLDQRGIAAQEVDLRFEDQVIVRPVVPSRTNVATAASTS